MRASVIIPALNEEKNLAESLPLVRAQLRSEDEVLVVDNGSTDQTAAVARSMNCTVIHEARRSRPKARNAGIERAGGDVLLFLDADCVPQQGWFRRMLAAFDDPTIGAVAGEIQTVPTDHALDRFLRSRGYLSQGVSFKHPFLPYGNTANVAYRRAVLNAIGGFDEKLPEGEDADLSWRMQLKTEYRLVMAPDAVVLHKSELKPLAFLRQKRRHAYGAVLLYKKYASDWKGPDRNLKETYWEYRSILSRAMRYGVQWSMARFGWAGRPNDDQGYQLLIEIGEKWGRLEGAIRHRVWFV